MPLPLPLPTSLRIGSDICSIRRIQRLITKLPNLDYWARHVFSRHELPCLIQRLGIYNAAVKNANKAAMERASDAAAKQTNGSAIRRSIHSGFMTMSADFARYELAKWLAGRWALKEAAIKAHSARTVLRTEVSILPSSYFAPAPSIPGPSSKPLVVIHGPRRTGLISMDYKVAVKRGLREIPRSEGGGDYGGTANGKNRQCVTFFRKPKIHLSDGRFADGSVSHDAGYATAVCLALDEEILNEGAGVVGAEAPRGPEVERTSKRLQPLPRVDDGEGPPIHEPLPGDSGWRVSLVLLQEVGEVGEDWGKGLKAETVSDLHVEKPSSPDV